MPDDVNQLTNSAARAETIRAAARYINERHADLKAIREEVAAYKATHIKGDLGMKISDFNALLRVYQLEGEDRDEFLDTLREGFAALGIGGQMDWVAEAERQAAQ